MTKRHLTVEEYRERLRTEGGKDENFRKLQSDCLKSRSEANEAAESYHKKKEEADRLFDLSDNGASDNGWRAAAVDEFLARRSFDKLELEARRYMAEWEEHPLTQWDVDE